MYTFFLVRARSVGLPKALKLKSGRATFFDEPTEARKAENVQAESFYAASIYYILGTQSYQLYCQIPSAKHCHNHGG